MIEEMVGESALQNPLDEQVSLACKASERMQSLG